MLPAQEHFQALLDRLVGQGGERGLQLAVYHRGRLVVNAAAGVRDQATGAPVETGTLFPVFSVGKGLTATIIHRLVDRGLLAYDDPIAAVWPEFAARGKEAVTLRQALNHTAGLPYMPAGIGFADLCDWSTMCRAIAALPTAWEPGTMAEYHPMTYGWILGETASRAAGKAFPALLAEEICGPLALENFYMGIPAGVENRIATLEEAPPVPAPPADPYRETVPRWALPLAESIARPEIRRACLPGFGAIANALSIARHYAALLPGGVDGVELLSPPRVRLAIEPQGARDAGGQPFPWLLGYASADTPFDPDRAPGAFGHDGHGGACGLADLRRGLGVGLARNRFLNPATRGLILAELREFFPVQTE
jgi:CubicO group peptidase (beta-lactamase class C family)